MLITLWPAVDESGWCGKYFEDPIVQGRRQ